MEVPMFTSQLIACKGRAAANAMVLAAALSGCATFQADQKCNSTACGSDAQITAAVEQSFALHPELGAPGDLQVETLNHVVYLNGMVYTDLQRNIANTVALVASNNAPIVNSIAVDNK
jgi:osmotically-inducible protein OsmY